MVTLKESHADETTYEVFVQNFLKQMSQSALLGVRVGKGRLQCAQEKATGTRRLWVDSRKLGVLTNTLKNREREESLQCA